MFPATAANTQASEFGSALAQSFNNRSFVLARCEALVTGSGLMQMLWRWIWREDLIRSYVFTQYIQSETGHYGDSCTNPSVITNVTNLFLNCGFMVYQYTRFRFCTLIFAHLCQVKMLYFFSGIFLSAKNCSVLINPPFFCAYLFCLTLFLSTCILLDWFLSWAPKGVTYRAFAGGCYKWKFTWSSVRFVNRAWWFVFPNWETKKTKDKCLYFAWIQLWL